YINLDFSKKSTLNDINITDTEFLIGDKYVSLYSIGSTDDMPQEVSTFSRHNKFSSDNVFFAVGYVSNLNLQLPFSHIYNQYFFLENQDKILKEVDSLSKHQASLSAVSRENAVNMEYNVEFIDDVTRNASRPVRCAFNVILWDNNYLTLQKKNTIVSARLASLDITATKTERIVPQIFWSGIPGASSYFPKEMRFLTCLEQGCCMINYESNSKTSTTGFGIRLCDRINGIPLNVDISDEPMSNGWTNNRNKFILGPSGSGKSFFTNHIVRQYYEQGTHVVIVDVGDSYLGLCKLINEETDGKDGVYYTYTEDNPISFNPFFVKDNVYTIEKKEQLSSLIFCLWKSETENITKAEETHISTAINDYIDLIVGKKTTPSFTNFYNFLKKDFKKKLQENKVERNHFDIENLLQVLRPYSEGGMYDYLLNAKENIDLLEKRFIVFEIDNIKDHKTLFPIVTLILMDTFISKMRHPSLGQTRKMILIEEAWKAISKAGTAEFIKYLFKTVRKHFGEAVVVTQEIEDIIGNEIVKNSILGNADCKILLDQRKYQNKFDIVQQVLALTNKESAIALSVNKDLVKKNRPPYKEVFISLNGNHTAVYAVEVSRQEYLTYTTEKREKVRLYELEKQTGSMANAIEAYIKEENIKK
ncbi:MAG: TraG family conjugative transposon ATPase, partial [Clostridia bacterium]|nr:TraG family conjugative transposon ATPase [Clostridia bacterium]